MNAIASKETWLGPYMNWLNAFLYYKAEGEIYDVSWDEYVVTDWIDRMILEDRYLKELKIAW